MSYLGLGVLFDLRSNGKLTVCLQEFVRCSLNADPTAPVPSTIPLLRLLEDYYPLYSQACVDFETGYRMDGAPLGEGDKKNVAVSFKTLYLGLAWECHAGRGRASSLDPLCPCPFCRVRDEGFFGAGGRTVFVAFLMIWSSPPASLAVIGARARAFQVRIWAEKAENVQVGRCLGLVRAN